MLKCWMLDIYVVMKETMLNKCVLVDVARYASFETKTERDCRVAQSINPQFDDIFYSSHKS